MSKFFPLKLKDVSNFHFASLCSILLIFLTCTNVHAQNVPEAINYQAVVRDASSYLPISDQAAYISVEYLNGPGGDVLYQEEFPSIQTGKAGLINLSLGQGNPVVNSFSSISWESGNIWLRLSVDVGNGLNILQESPFNTVPYAFYAESSGGSDADSDPTNEFQDLGNTIVTPNEEVEITLTDGANTMINIQDSDADSTNELIESAEFNGTDLVIVEGGITRSVDLSGFSDDADADPTNEFQDLGNTVVTPNEEVEITLTDGASTTINIQDADADASNELQTIESTDGSITVTPSGNDFDLSVAAADGSETIINDGVNTTINGTGTSADPYSIDVPDNLDNDASNELQTIESTDGSITVTPSGNDFDLSVAAADGSETIINDGQNTSINGTGTSADPYSIDVPDNLDNDASNELQDISTDNSAGNISLSDGSTLTLNVDDADADASNELQTIESTDGSITVTPSGNDFDLSVAAADGSETIINDGVNTTINGTGTSADPYSIDVPDNLDNDPVNEIQDISTDNTAGNIALSDGSTLTLNVDDADADASNELQTIESTDGSITVTPSGNDFDLSVAAADGSETIINDGVNTTINGTGTSADPYSIDVPDNLDNDASNELQDISTDNSAGNISLSDGSTLTLNVDDADADASNELQTIESTDGSITVTPNGNDFDLSVAAADGSETIINDGQNTTITGTGTSADPYSIAVPDNLDNDASNELQDISTDNSAGNISVSDGSTITLNVNDADADASNELQNIESTDGSITVTPNGNDFDLSVAAADGSETIINDGQNTTITGTGTSADPYSIDVPDNLDNDASNELQDISTDNSAGNISLSDGSTITLNVNDADADASNELQTIESTDGSITVTPNGNDFDLSVATADGSETIINDGQNTTITGTGTSVDPYSIDVPDNLDNDPTNEFQDLGNTVVTPNEEVEITLTDGANTTINIQDADADASNELQTIESTDGSITVTPNGNDFDLSVAAADGSETIINDGQNTTITGTGTSADPYSIDVPDNLDNSTTNELQDISTDNSAGNISLSDGSTITLNVNDADADASNELQNIESTDGSIAVTPNGNDFDLSVAAADGSETIINDGQNTTITGTGTSVDPYSIDVPDNLDNDPTNEFQDLGNTVVTPNEEVEITLTDGANTTINIQDADADASNELQTIESTDGSITVTPNGNDFDLSVAAADGSETIINDGQNTTITGTGTSADPYSIDVPDNLDNSTTNELQDISTDNSAGNISLSDGSTITLNVNDADADASNELQNIESTDGSIAVTPNGNDFDLSVAAADGSETIINDGQNTTITGTGTSGDPYVVDVPDNLDNSTTNELQDISTDNSAGNISLSDGSTITLNVNDADADASNELQNIESTDGSITVTPNGNDFDLSVAAADGSETIINDGQNTTITGTGTSADPYSIDVPDNLDNDASNELQNIESTDGSITVTPNGNDFDLSVAAADGSETIINDGQNTTITGTGTSANPYSIAVPDNLDNDASNELQDISTDNSAGNISVSDGSTITLNVNDADADASNELQNVQLSGDFLSLTNVSPAAQVDLSPYDQSDLSQGHIFVGDGSDKATEVEVFGDIELDSSGETTVRGIQGVDVNGTSPDNGDVLVYSSANSEWQPRSPASITATTTTSYYSIDPLDFRELTDPDGGTDLNQDNAVKFYNEEAPFALIRNSSNFNALGAAVHLPHGATVTQVRVFFRDTALGNMQFRLVRKNITTVSNTNETLANLSGFGAVGNVAVTDNTIANEVIDNSTYNYRFIAEFTYQENDNEPDITFEMNQRVYGAIIEYTVD